MSGDCDKYKLKDVKGPSNLNELEERIVLLEEELDKLTNIVKCMSDYMLEKREKEVNGQCDKEKQ